MPTDARPPLRVLSLATPLLLAGACTTFAFPAPDASTAPPPAFLDLSSAASVCTLAFACPGLAQAIEGSLVIPVGTPSSPMSFSSCMSWLAGPVDPARPGLALQRRLLQAIAATTDCASAYQAAPIHPVPDVCTGSTCTDAGLLQICTVSSAFTTACDGPLFDEDAGACATVLGTTTCITSAACPRGLSCDPTGTRLVECLDGTRSVSFDCSLSGRACAAASGTAVAACVTVDPPSLAAPCGASQIPSDTCTGGNVVHCVSQGAQSVFDCGPLGSGWTCSTQGGAAHCVPPGAPCDPLGASSTACGPGTTIDLCVGGQQVTFDCATLPGPTRTCQPATTSQTAHCG